MSQAASTARHLAQRYRIDRALGRGGSGQTFAALDEREQRMVALRRFRLNADAGSSEELQALFKREYAILAQFDHPNMVKVYDFGLDDGVPFYTMELIEGEHPGMSSAMPWRDVCRLLARLCEPLALLHSRGWVHRDVSPRNVYVTEDGSVKLLDFGAVTSFDEPQRPIGTPPCVAPETLARQAIDGRTDMFGLGALGYFALTGHHAYPARVLSQLPLLWQTPPIKPSDYALEIPQALDELILSLLSLERDGRPRQIAEVVARLFAIAGLPSDQATELARASLTNTGLIGRERELEQLRDLLRWSEGGRSATGVIRGARGSGCTRLLDAFALEAKLRGHTVVRANASLCGGSDFALARELCRSIWTHEPDLASATGPSLERALAVLDGRAGAEAHNIDGQRAFIAWCERWAKRQPLLLIVDEADELDSESAKSLAQLARRTEGIYLTIALSLRSERSRARGPIASLVREATDLELKPLDYAGIERLLRALFGDVPNLARVAHYCHRASEGLPGAAVNAARSLVERGLVKFASGSWQLPDHVDDPELTASERAAVSDDLSRLSAVAAEFLRVLALVTEPAPFPAPRYVRALLRPDSAIVTAEGELFARHVLVTTNQGYAVADRSLLAFVRERMRPNEAEFAHTQLAEFYASSSRGACAAYHFWRAGRPNQADLALAAVLSPLGDPLGEDPSSFTSSSAAVALYEAMLARRKKRRAAPSDLYPLRMMLLNVATADHLELSRYAAETIDQLRIDAGIDLYEARADAGMSEPDEASMRACLVEAKARHEQTAPTLRGLPPELATRAIASCVTRLTSVYPARFDVAASQRLELLVRPLRALSPLLELAGTIAEQWSAVLTRDDDVTSLRLRTLGAIRNQREIPSELREVATLTTSYYLAIDHASAARNDALEVAAELQRVPAAEALALQIRRMHALAYARFEDAQRFRRERELLSFQSAVGDHQIRMVVHRELYAAYECRDLLDVTRYSMEIAERAALYPGWRAWAALGQAFRHMLADEPVSARAVADGALAELRPFSHGAYAHLVWVKADAHNEQREFRDAKRALVGLLDEADARQVTLSKRPLFEASLAVAEAGSGAREEAFSRFEDLLARSAIAPGRDSLLFGRLCEARCMAACIVKDYSGFAKHLQWMEPVFARHPSLRARHARWVRAGKERFYKLLAVLSQADAAAKWTVEAANDRPSRGLEHQGEYLLSMVLDAISVDTGQLFRIAGDHSLQLLAARPTRPDPQLLRAAEHCLATWTSSDEMLTQDGDDADDAELVDSQGRAHTPLWLTHPSRPAELTGLVLVACASTQLGSLSPAFVQAVSQQLETLA